MSLEQVKIDKAVEFSKAFVSALEAGHIQFGISNLHGWEGDCDCSGCHDQKIIVDYLWPKIDCPDCWANVPCAGNCPHCGRAPDELVVADSSKGDKAVCEHCGSDYWAFANCPNCGNG